LIRERKLCGGVRNGPKRCKVKHFVMGWQKETHIRDVVGKEHPSFLSLGDTPSMGGVYAVRGQLLLHDINVNGLSATHNERVRYK
jgi:hypothetical protein